MLPNEKIPIPPPPTYYSIKFLIWNSKTHKSVVQQKLESQLPFIVSPKLDQSCSFCPFLNYICQWFFLVFCFFLFSSLSFRQHQHKSFFCLPKEWRIYYPSSSTLPLCLSLSGWELELGAEILTHQQPPQVVESSFTFFYLLVLGALQNSAWAEIPKKFLQLFLCHRFKIDSFSTKLTIQTQSRKIHSAAREQSLKYRRPWRNIIIIMG